MWPEVHRSGPPALEHVQLLRCNACSLHIAARRPHWNCDNAASMQRHGRLQGRSSASPPCFPSTKCYLSIVSSTLLMQVLAAPVPMLASKCLRACRRAVHRPQRAAQGGHPGCSDGTSARLIDL